MFNNRFLSDNDLTRLWREYPGLKNASCPTCKGAKTYRWQGEDHDCVCSEQQQLHISYLHAGIGVIYQRLNWDDFFGPQEALDTVKDYVQRSGEYIDRGIGLFFGGALGTGKSMLANLVLKELVKAGYDCHSTTFASTITSFTAGWNSRDDAAWFADRFMYSQVLLLDDLGKEFRRSNQLHATTFDHILRTRVQGGRPTILTSNMTSSEVQKGYGAAVLSLLVEQSIEINLTGNDYRPKAHDRTVAEVQRGERRPIC